MLARGNDHNYAVVKHQLCHGPIIIICQRCWHVEEPPDQALNRRGATAEQKAEYKKLYERYQWWLNLPTDNVMSGPSFSSSIATTNQPPNPPRTKAEPYKSTLRKRGQDHDSTADHTGTARRRDGCSGQRHTRPAV